MTPIRAALAALPALALRPHRSVVEAWEDQLSSPWEDLCRDDDLVEEVG